MSRARRHLALAVFRGIPTAIVAASLAETWLSAMAACAGLVAMNHATEHIIREDER